MAQRDLYDVLELSKGASASEVKKAYKRLARKYHPDLNPGDKASEDRFKEISEAYSILGNAEKKKQYDTYGTVGEMGPQGGPNINFEGFDYDRGSGASGFGDLFDSFFRTARSRPEEPSRPGGDLTYPLHLSLSEAFTGKKTRIRVTHTVSCDACGGKGRLTTGTRRPCDGCGGTGRAGINKGPLFFSSTCQNCGGTGESPGEPCLKCGGTGATNVTESMDVSIPAGVDTGSKVRLKGKGQAGKNGGPPGDLLIETHIEKHPYFEREGQNLKIMVPVTFPEAVLGTRIEVPTVMGGARLKIPPGTRSGQVFRLKGRGMPSLRGGTSGDLMVTADIAVPSVVDEKSKELLEEFARLNPQAPREERFHDGEREAASR